MRKRTKSSILIILIFINMFTCKADVFAAMEEPDQLYGQSALLMDGDSGRVLFEKNGYAPMPMASTTKIMTCITALENGAMEDVVTVSKEAAKAPDVQMNIGTGEEYRLGDLLYGMMLESYNDVAIAVMDHFPGFIDKMNQKALELGCSDTHFVTPNGLDGEDDAGIHHTTAKDLALIMRYCIKNETFLTITQTESYEIAELHGARKVTAHNHNSLLHDYEGVISGKTGFTGKAGYCYVGALHRDERTFIGVVLACGWPPHKTYKWSDMGKLFDYAIDHYRYEKYNFEAGIPDKILIEDGKSKKIGALVTTELLPDKNALRLLTCKEDQVTMQTEVPERISAPVKKKQQLGVTHIYLNGDKLESIPIRAASSVSKLDYSWCFKQILNLYVL